tara:strand:+ start:1094 stop:2518 length:1425 start_codon:yes stop_codon:yes gene_type:complete
MLKFPIIDQKLPNKRDALSRTKDWGEIYQDFKKSDLKDQSSRCSQCGVPFCQLHCPLHNNIPDWLMLSASDRLQEAYEVSSSTNNFPEICGRICPQDRLCEGNCVIEKDFESVTIGAIERHITDTAFKNGWVKPVKPQKELSKSIGIIGAGPAGLAAAENLRRYGYRVFVYDRYDRIGGLLIYGIPNFKLEKEIVNRRANLIKDSGVIFEMNFEIGRDASLDDLRQRHHAVLIATGTYKAKNLDIRGIQAKNIVQALDYLTVSNRVGLGDKISQYNYQKFNAKDHDVVVVGGGDTAMDCVRTAVRQGALSVSCVYRRDRKNMPGSLSEVKHAEEEGVNFHWLSTPEAFIGTTKVESLEIAKIRLGNADNTGRQVPIRLDNSTQSLNSSYVIKALGFDPEDLPRLFDCPELKVTQHGTLAVNQITMMCSIEGVFAAGDIVRGASLVVWAIKDGRDAAESIHKFLKGKDTLIHATN